MKIISLSAGRVSLIDDCDYERASQYVWSFHVEGYAFRSYGPRSDRRYEYMHRFILENPIGNIDHINRDGLDNRRTNLRVASKSMNALNSGPQSNNTSGARGVDWDKRRQKWCARIKVNGTQYYLGRFCTKEEAVAARRKAEVGAATMRATGVIGAHRFYKSAA